MRGLVWVSKELYEADAEDKNFAMVEGDHNSALSKFFMDPVAIFFFNTLQCDSLPRQFSPPPRGGGPDRARSGGGGSQAGGFRSVKEEPGELCRSGFRCRPV